MTTQTFVENELEALAQRLMASKGLSYPQAYAEALEQRPDLYDAYSADAAARVDSLAQQQQREPRQATAPYVPGRGTQRAAEDALEKEARRIQASAPDLSDAQAYARALESNRHLYDEQHVAGQRLQSFAEAGVPLPETTREARQFGTPGNRNDFTGSSTPAGIARLTTQQTLMESLNTALAPLQRQYPKAPRDLLLACLLDDNKALRRRCVAAAKLSNSNT